MSLLSIKAALEVRLKAISSPLATAWENSPFDAPSGKPYQAVHFMPTPPENPTMGDSFRRERGIMQVTLYYPQSGGAGTAVSKAVALQEWFPRGSTYVANGITTTIERTPEIGGGRIVGDRFAVPVSIRYYANILAP